jgi:PKD repeat protein
MKKLLTILLLLIGFTIKAQLFFTTSNLTATTISSGTTSTICLNASGIIQVGNTLDSIVYSGIIGNTINLIAHTTTSANCNTIALTQYYCQSRCIPVNAILNSSYQVKVYEVAHPYCNSPIVNSYIGIVSNSAAPFSCCNANFTSNISSSGIVNFNNTSTSSNPTMGSYWDFGDGTTSQANSPSHTYTVNGTYNVCMYWLDTFTNQICDTLCSSVTISNVSQANCTASMTYSSNACQGLFVNTSAAGYTSATWFWGDGTSSSNLNQTVLHTYGASAVYYPYLVITYGTAGASNYCKDTSNIGQLPITCSTSVACNAAFTDTMVVNGGVYFMNLSSAVNSYTSYWSFGDGTTSSSANPFHTYANNGTYNVCLYIKDSISNCKDTICHSIVINNTPTSCTASMTYSSNACQGIFVNTSASGYSSATWYWGDGTSSINNATTVTHTYSNSGVYYPYLVITYGTNSTSNYCKDTSNIGQLPITCSTSVACNAAFTDTMVNGGVYFINLSSAVNSYTSYWSFGDGTTSSSANPIHTYANNGTYNVCLYIKDSISNCKDTICHSIVINNTPTSCTASMSYSSNACQGIFVNTSANGYTNAVWYWGDGTSSSNLNQTVLHTYGASGVYYPYLVITYGNAGASNYCSDTSNIGQLYVNCNSAICNAIFYTNVNGNIVTFIDSSTYSSSAIVAYWSFGDGQTAFQLPNSQGPLHTYTTPGTYTACLFLIDSASQTICDSQCNTITVIANVPLCNASYQVFDSNGVYYFYNTSTVPAGATYTSAWYFGDGMTSTASNPTHTYVQPGTYLACLVILSTNNCIDSICKVVTVPPTNPNCTANFTYNVNLCSATFTNTSTGNATNAIWSFGNNTFNTQNTATVTGNYTANGVYNVCLVIFDSASNCADSVCKSVVIFNCPTGINNINSLTQVSIAPNPTKADITLNMPSQQQVIINVYSQIGELLYNTNSNQKRITLPMINFASGIYMLSITNTNGERIIRKIVKE